MRYEEINDDYKKEYLSICDKCGKKYKILTNEKPNLEFAIKCDSCDEYVVFD